MSEAEGRAPVRITAGSDAHERSKGTIGPSETGEI